MSLRIYNTKTKTKEPLILDPERPVGIYVCGPTVYDCCHLGHARSFVVFDVLRRYLEHCGHKVRFVQNFTDVAEEVSKVARKLNVKTSEVAERFIEEYFRDMDALNIRRADVYPRVSEHIADILATIEAFIDDCLAYEIDGDVYFDTSTSSGYGVLSGLTPEELIHKVEFETEKRSLLDFALWRKPKEFEERWESPWGNGRPGWHVECYTMASKHLGLPVDVQGGGLDLRFPHHESELMMSKACNGKDFARIYMHHGFLTMSSKKMSKSTGHFIALRPLIERFGWRVLRFYLIRTHYRANIDYSEEALESAGRELGELLGALKKLGSQGNHKPHDDKNTVPEGYADEVTDTVKTHSDGFHRAMDDDLDTSKAIDALLEFAKWALGARLSKAQNDLVKDKLESFLGILGL